MASSFILRWDEGEVDKLLKSPNGVVGRDLKVRANKVLLAAKKQVGVDTGALKKSLSVRNQQRTTYGQSISVGSDLHYARMHHNGTRPHVIRPTGKRGEYLVFKSGQRTIYTTSVMHPGTKPNRYLTDNLRLAVRKTK
jgi:hypothetical protein